MKKIIAVLMVALIAKPVLAQLPVYLDETKPIESRVQDALSRMTTEEKVAMCHAQSKFTSPGCPRLGIPELHMSDGPHGVRAEINWDNWGYAGWTNDSCTAFPSLTALASTWNTDLAAQYGQALAEECLYRNKNVILGPGVNIARTPLNGRNFEYMGEDPFLAATLCVPYIQAVQKNGVATCVKHYVLNDQELWRGHINVELSDRALHEIYLYPFKAAIEKGKAWSIMGAYNKIRGQHACHNELTINKILKGDWKFDGCVITDWGGCHDTYEAAMNGLDIEMGSYTNGLTSESKFTYDDYYLAKPFLKMIKEGKVPMTVLNDKASRILRLIFRTAMNKNRGFGSMASAEHYDVARRVADEAIVLLKNENNILPLKFDDYKKILVVGENGRRTLVQAGGSSELKPKHETSPLEGISKLAPGRVKYAEGYRSGASMFGRVEVISDAVYESLRAEAVEAAKDADLVIYVGGLNKNHEQDCEAGDRTTFGLPFYQDKLIESILQVNKNFVMVLCSGNPVMMPWLKDVPAIIQTWYGGSAAGDAIADVLSGKVNPSGKLPMTYGVKLEDYGAHSFGSICYPGDSINVEYKEDVLVGYRWFDTKKIKPQFPFGFGLSYTTFEYGKPIVSTKTMSAGGNIIVRVPVKNVGSVEGKETVQLYIGDVKCSVTRPLKELKGFEKISLAPGEEKVVSFTITDDMLKFYSDRKHDWVFESGAFKAYIGSSSRDIKCTIPFTLK